jgi:hypothetical protein
MTIWDVEKVSLFVRVCQLAKRLAVGSSWETIAMQEAEKITMVDAYTMAYLDEGDGNTIGVPEHIVKQVADYCNRQEIVDK